MEKNIEKNVNKYVYIHVYVHIYMCVCVYIYKTGTKKHIYIWQTKIGCKTLGELSGEIIHI